MILNYIKGCVDSGLEKLAQEEVIVAVGGATCFAFAAQKIQFQY